MPEQFAANAIFQKVIKVLGNLPPLSMSALKVVKIANDPQSTPRDLINVIKLDPVLTGKILKLMSSSFYSTRQKVTGLNRALVLLGFNTIKNICLSTAMMEATRGGETSYFNIDELWVHLFAVGVVSKLLGKVARKSKEEQEELFIGGLLHDIGDLMLMRFVPDEFFKVTRVQHDKKIDIIEATRECFGFDAHDLGVKVAQEWSLPEDLQKIISFKYYEGKDAHYESKVVHIADRFCRANEWGYVIDRTNCDISSEEYDDIDVDEGDWGLMVDEIMGEVDKAKGLLKMQG